MMNSSKIPATLNHGRKANYRQRLKEIQSVVDVLTSTIQIKAMVHLVFGQVTTD